MYTLPSKLKFFAIILMVIGALGIVTGFLSTPSNTDEVKEMLASSHDDGHQTEATHTESHAEQSHDENIHDDDSHYEHVLHGYLVPHFRLIGMGDPRPDARGLSSTLDSY